MLHYNEWTEKLSKIIYCKISKLTEILEDSDYLLFFILDTQYVL